jgi:hypothetical protein
MLLSGVFGRLAIVGRQNKLGPALAGLARCLYRTCKLLKNLLCVNLHPHVAHVVDLYSGKGLSPVFVHHFLVKLEWQQWAGDISSNP